MPEDPERVARLAREARSHIERTMHRRYAINLEALDAPSLREVIRLIRDVEEQQGLARQKALREGRGW